MENDYILINHINSIIYRFFYKKDPNSLKKYPDTLYVKYDLADDDYQVLFHSADNRDGKLVNMKLLDFINVNQEITLEEIKLISNLIRKRTTLMRYEEDDNLILYFERDEDLFSGITYNNVIISFSFKNLSLEETKRVKSIIMEYIHNLFIEQESALIRKKPNSDK